jgi:peptidoglycan/LPS O-acetylase OafA/YrhL
MIESHPYRADIDGLRALAILPVVLFHADVPGFGGGYVGVDVFFVISGYLITSIIVRELDTGSFSLMNFYERRVRRILPALFVTLLATALLASLMLYPREAKDYARSLVAATLFFSSIFFYQKSGYFDLEAERQPLLHTWSLSVEEIFYIFFPPLMLLLWRHCRRQAFGWVLVIAVLSLSGATLALGADPGSPAAFYLPPFRAWELMIGVLVALNPWRLPHFPGFANLLSLVGLAMIAFPVFFYSSNTVFPGVAALLPCGGAALILLGGQRRPSVVGRFLSWRPLVILGLISYSLYLWHWPVFVYGRIWIGAAPGLGQAWLLIGISLTLAVLSWRFVERPFRGRSGILPGKRIFALAGLAGLTIVGIGLHGEKTGGWLGRYPPELATILAAPYDNRDPRQGECLSTSEDAKGCQYGDLQAPPVLALWGDSFAAVYAPVLGEVARGQGGSLLSLTMAACPPAVDWQPVGQSWRDACRRFQNIALERLVATPGIHTVILSANFHDYLHDEGAVALPAALRGAVARLLSAGKTVALAYPVPRLGDHVPNRLADAILAGEDPDRVRRTLAEFLTSHRGVFALLDHIPDAGGLIRLYPHEVFCPEGECRFYSEGQPWYYDDAHLSLTGADRVRPLFESILDPRSQAALAPGE